MESRILLLFSSRPYFSGISEIIFVSCILLEEFVRCHLCSPPSNALRLPNLPRRHIIPGDPGFPEAHQRRRCVTAPAALDAPNALAVQDGRLVGNESNVVLGQGPAPVLVELVEEFQDPVHVFLFDVPEGLEHVHQELVLVDHVVPVGVHRANVRLAQGPAQELGLEGVVPPIDVRGGDPPDKGTPKGDRHGNVKDAVKLANLVVGRPVSEPDGGSGNDQPVQTLDDAPAFHDDDGNRQDQHQGQVPVLFLDNPVNVLDKRAPKDRLTVHLLLVRVVVVVFRGCGGSGSATTAARSREHRVHVVDAEALGGQALQPLLPLDGHVAENSQENSENDNPVNGKEDAKEHAVVGPVGRDVPVPDGRDDGDGKVNGIEDREPGGQEEGIKENPNAEVYTNVEEGEVKGLVGIIPAHKAIGERRRRLGGGFFRFVSLFFERQVRRRTTTTVGVVVLVAQE